MCSTMLSRRVVCVSVGLIALGAVLAGCGGSKSSSSTAPSSTSASLKRLEVEVVPSSTARAPGGSFLARVASLFGWPQVAEAAPGLAGCQVSAAGAATQLTDAEGKAVLTNVPVPNTVNILCPDGTTASFPVSGPPGAVVSVKVEAKAGKLEVKAKNEDVSPSVSVSKPSVSGNTGSNSGSGS